MSGSGKIGATSNVSERMAEAVKVVERALNVVALAGVVVVVVCVVTLIAAGTFATLHKGDDFDFGGGGSRGGDIIVLPAQPF